MARKKAEEAKRKAEAEEAKRKAAALAAKKKAEAEALARKKAEEAKRKAEALARKQAEEAKRKAEEEAKRQAALAATKKTSASKVHTPETVAIERLEALRHEAEKKKTAVAQQKHTMMRGMGVTGVVNTQNDQEIDLAKEQAEAAKKAQEELLKAIAAVDRED